MGHCSALSRQSHFFREIVHQLMADRLAAIFMLCVSLQWLSRYGLLRMKIDSKAREVSGRAEDTQQKPQFREKLNCVLLCRWNYRKSCMSYEKTSLRVMFFLPLSLKHNLKVEHGSFFFLFWGAVSLYKYQVFPGCLQRKKAEWGFGENLPVILKY